jgi:acyl-coenzyme A thioesterase PaaI-like protein
VPQVEEEPVIPQRSAVAGSFSAASAVRPLGDGTFAVELPPDWTVGNRPHGGFQIALLGRAALHAVVASGVDNPATLDALAVSVQFLRAPEVGPALLRTEVRKLGRTASVVAVQLEQRGRSCVEGTVTVGALTDEPVAWTDLPAMAAKPPAEALDLSAVSAASVFKLSRCCEIRLDPTNTGFLQGRSGDPLRLRMWLRPRGEQPDALFALLAGDVSMPVTFNLGRVGWSPTVQLTTLLRGRPAPGWLRIEVSSRAVHGQWFDEDATVVDATGRLVSQTRQLALLALERPNSAG